LILAILNAFSKKYRILSWLFDWFDFLMKHINDSIYRLLKECSNTKNKNKERKKDVWQDYLYYVWIMCFDGPNQL